MTGLPLRVPEKNEKKLHNYKIDSITFQVYILYSPDSDRYYIGQTSNLDKRLERHQKGYVKSTKNYLPVKLVYCEICESRSEAVLREKELKSWKSKQRLKELVNT